MAKLIFRNPETGASREFPLKPNRTSVGRLPSQDVYLPHDSVSREHADIRCIDDDYLLIDKRSLNGVYLNGRRVSKATLHEGDEVIFGKVGCTFSLSPTEHSLAGGGVWKPLARFFTSLQDQAHSMEGDFDSMRDFLATEEDDGETTTAPTVQGATVLETLKRRTQRFEQAYRQLSILFRTSQWIHLDISLDNVLSACIDQVVAALKMDRGFLFTFDPGRDEMDCRAARDRGIEDDGARRFSLIRSISRRVLETKEPLAFTPIFKTSNAVFLTASASVFSILSVPVIGTKDNALGVLYFDCRDSSLSYTQDDLDFLATFASQVALALERDSLIEEVIAKREIEREVGIARDIQQRLLPKVVPQSSRFALAGRSIPSRSVGGDYYDFAKSDDGSENLHLIVADVSGKGIPAALVLSETRSILQVYAREHFSPKDTLARLNDNLLLDFDGSMYVTLVYCDFDWERSILRYANAGHEWPLLISPNSETVTYLDRSTKPCGLFEGEEYEEVEIAVSPGDKIIFPTDGIIDAENEQGKKFGLERLEATVLANRDKSAQDMLDHVFDEVARFSGDGPQFDDMTLVVIDILGDGSFAPAS